MRARSGEEALKHLLQNSFAAILLDVQMPGMDGFQTAALIKARKRTQHAILFVTAIHRDTEHIFRGYEHGAVDYLIKPFNADVLRSKVAMLLQLQEKNAELRASEERFRAAFEGAPIGMGLSTVDGHWLEVNDALCELLGDASSTATPAAPAPTMQDLERLHGATGQPAGVGHRRQRDDGGPMLVVVEDRDVERLLQAPLDLEAPGGGDVLEVDAAEGGEMRSTVR